jgi:hypothetical protein
VAVKGLLLLLLLLLVLLLLLLLLLLRLQQPSEATGSYPLPRKIWKWD